MNLKKILIERTGREGLIYDLADYALFSWQKMVNYLICGHFIRQRTIKLYRQKHTAFQLHLGCGQIILPGFLNSDILGSVPIDITRRLPLPDQSVDLIFSYHLIEHIYRRQLKLFLAESRRVLKDDGIMIAGTPSLAKMCRLLYCSADVNQKNILLNYYQKFYPPRQPALTPAQFLNDSLHILFGHKYLYDLDLLKEMGEAAGFRAVTLVLAEEIDSAAIRAHLPSPATFRAVQSELFRFEK